MKKSLKALFLIMVLVVGATLLSSCAKKEEKQVIIHSNADDEAAKAIKATLDKNGFEGKYQFQTFGTSELGGKLLAEGKNIEADLITMSSFYIESTQKDHKMYLDLNFKSNAINKTPAFYTPALGIEGAIIINTSVMEAEKLPKPTSIKDLSNPIYAGKLSVVDIQGSSTAWLMIQALVNEYGEDEAKVILKGIYKNAGAHLEKSGSGPIKKVRAGEVAIGFGLRHQAVADKASSKPIDFIDPKEGNFMLTESVAVIDKGDKTNPLAMQMAACIIEKGRPEIMKSYPVALYSGEVADNNSKSSNPKVFSEALTVELLNKHKKLSDECK